MATKKKSTKKPAQKTDTENKSTTKKSTRKTGGTRPKTKKESVKSKGDKALKASSVKDIKAPTSWNSLDSMLNEYKSIQAKMRSSISKRDNEIAKIHAKYADEINQCSQQLNELEPAIKAFIRSRKNDFDGDKRSRKLKSGTVGFRLGTPALIPASGHTFVSIIETMQSNLEKFGKWLKVETSVNRRALIDAKDPDLLSELNLELSQQDREYFDVG